jgi:hypothetical protein
MSHYVMVDGQLVRSTWETKNWLRRAAKAVPTAITREELAETLKKAAECDRIIGVHRSDYQILEELDEIPE